jgi:ABC-type nitrate/sulfonate/bicarbonate transport system ATPase subunit
MSDEEKKPEEGKEGGAGAGDAASSTPKQKEEPEEAAKLDPAAAAAALEAFESQLAPDKKEPDKKATIASDKQESTEPNADGAEGRSEATPQSRPSRDEGTAKQDRPPVVVFDHVTKTYNAGTAKAFTAVKDVHFTVEDIPDKGEFISILGPSGCGKSTVLRLIAALEPQHPPTEGRVEVFGKQVTAPGADRGMVFQSYTSFDNRTVLRNLTFGLECRGIKKQDRVDLAKLWIGKVGLSVKHDADKYPHQLSGGMQQRVAIARTLILHPKIILMDEPFGALDPVTRLNMQDLLVTLWRDQEATVFFVTHSIPEAVYLGDRCYLFSASPGTILREVPVPPPNRPAMEMQKDPAFQETVYQLSEEIHDMEEAEQQRKNQAEGM